MDAPAEDPQTPLAASPWHSSDASVMLGALLFPFSITVAPESGGHTQLVLRL